MTPNEIMAEVAAIAQEEIENVNEKAFYAALNRAYETVNRLRPKTKSCEIYNTALQVMSETHRAHTVTANSPLVIEAANTACFSLLLVGRGVIVVQDARGEILREEILSPDTECDVRQITKKLCGEETADLKIRIEAAPRITVTAYALYADRYSDDEEDVPLPGIYNIHPLKRIAPDYITIKSIEKVDDRTRQLLDDTNYMIASENELWMLRALPGRYRITYTYRLKRLSYDNADEPIGLDADLDQPLILLTAYYLWYEDITPLAEHCYAMYLQTVAELKTEERAANEPAFKNVYGW